MAKERKNKVLSNSLCFVDPREPSQGGGGEALLIIPLVPPPVPPLVSLLLRVVQADDNNWRPSKKQGSLICCLQKSSFRSSFCSSYDKDKLVCIFISSSPDSHSPPWRPPPPGWAWRQLSSPLTAIF